MEFSKNALCTAASAAHRGLDLIWFTEVSVVFFAPWSHWLKIRQDWGVDWVTQWVFHSPSACWGMLRISEVLSSVRSTKTLDKTVSQ
jgi:hypothetical protein